MKLLCSKTCLLCYAAILLKCPYYAQQSTYYAPIMPSFYKTREEPLQLYILPSAWESKLFIATVTVVIQFPFKTETLKSNTSYTGCWGPIMPLQAPIMLVSCSMLSHTYIMSQFYAGIIAACLFITERSHR